MIPRILEPESMDGPEEVAQYDAMDHRAVNEVFVADFLAAHGPCRGGEVLDIGTGTARIPIALALADPKARVVGFDLAPAMIERARRNVAEAGLTDRIGFILGDAKDPAALGNALYEAVVSNTIIHHIPEPVSALRVMIERLAPGGTLFIRDLYRPDDQATLAALVDQYAGEESPEARELFRASLHAALTLDETLRLVDAGVDLRIVALLNASQGADVVVSGVRTFDLVKRRLLSTESPTVALEQNPVLTLFRRNVVPTSSSVVLTREHAERAGEFPLWERLLVETRYVGEVGLDAGPRFYKSLDIQKHVFRTVLERCAEAGGKILTVHSVRSAPAVLDAALSARPGAGRKPRDVPPAGGAPFARLAGRRLADAPP